MNGVTAAIPSPVPDRLIGRGRRAAVWAARHGDTAVAWKRYDDATDPALSREHQARAAAHHARLVPLLASTSDGIVMPLATSDLATSVRQNALGHAGLAALLRDVGGALAALHEAAWVHGDLAPTNVVLTPDGWSLIDLDQSGPVLDPPVGVGTPGYVAPEVAAGGPGSVAADVHAFAATVTAAAHGRFGLPPSWRPTFDAALCEDPARRPALAQLLALTPDQNLPPAPIDPTDPTDPTDTTALMTEPMDAPTGTQPEVLQHEPAAQPGWVADVPIARTVDWGAAGPAAASGSVSASWPWLPWAAVAVVVVESAVYDGSELALTLLLQAPPAVAVLGWETRRRWRDSGTTPGRRRGRIWRGSSDGVLIVALRRMRQEVLESLDAGVLDESPLATGRFRSDHRG